MVKVHQLVAAIATTITLSTSSAYALNMGSISWKSSYGQPLDARIELSDAKNLQASDIKSSIANTNDFSKAGLEYSPTLSNLSFSTIINPDGTGYIKITSAKPIKEPFMNFLIDVNWPNGKASKEYTILLDMPESKATTPTPKTNNTAKNTVSSTPPISSPSQVANTYKTKQGDTLWSIAKANYGKSLTAKASKAIFEKNPKAFINGDINSLLHSYTLSMPTQQEVNAISVAQANAFLSSPSKEVPTTATQKKPISDKHEKALQDQLKSSQQELETARTENTTLNTELENIESEIASLEQVSKEKDEAIAKAEQAKLAATQATQQKAQKGQATTTSQTADQQNTSQTPVEPQQTTTTNKPVEPTVAQSHAEPKPQSPKTNTAPESQPAKSSTPTPVEDTSPSFISSLLDNNMMLLAGGGILLLLCIAVVISRRKKAANDDDAQVVDLSNVVLDDEDLNDSLPNTQISATKIPDNDVISPLSQLGEGMGIIDKADIYLAYNHDEEAKELLSNALQEDPTNTELRLKLMEIYADKGNTDSFEKEEQELLLLDPLSQHKIDAIKEKYPTSFNDFSFSNNPTSVKEQNETFTSFKQDAKENTQDTPNEEPEFSFDYADFAEPVVAPTPKETKLASASPETEETEIPMKRLEEDAANFKLEKIAPETQHASSPLFNATEEEDFSSDSPTTIFEKEEDTQSKESNEGIKFDLGIGDQKSDSIDYISQIESNDLDDDIIEKDQVTTKLELVHAYMDMGDTEGAQDLLKEIIQEGNEAQKNEAQSLLASLNTTPSTHSNDSMHIAQESTDHDLFNSVDHSNTALTELELGFELPPEDEVSTKLELANAYIEMGDEQGAKDILDEVLHEGNAEQKLKAQDLLKSIS
ncbi:hypothetical protein DM558_15235 [Entomomonas moraniae]|uniref:LysM domain-containing protein n=1 Tax=Entomomonas moraniae TaxID=2213226 RepID=A0A3Q9JL21_9GAMM|nr:FimV/HubP family polar landmark protein [Entomomonas moraniae]AZS52042.1 hypothetical protein DM558_15235 [Entomomonas moraniae]